MANDGHFSRRPSLGEVGERIAFEYLIGHGFVVIQRNYRFLRGEIDLVAREGDVLVFCEVKTRQGDTYGPPEAAITPSKQRQLRKVAEGFLAEREMRNQACRFDVLAIRLDGRKGTVNHIRNAF